MCGIAGLVGAGSRDPAVIAAMTRRLEHRGPDDEGQWIDPEAGVALGHRRLSIVDLSPAGHEPMVSASGRLVITYNGEIYNHAAIRAELERRGQAPEGGWRGHSDVETFLEAIDHWGLEEALDQAVGMFAFALWDRKQRSLRLVRDRFGEKPLYWGWAGRDFVFASELKAFHAHPDFEPTINPDALSEYTSRLCVPAPLSIYHEVFKLQPGRVLTVDGTTVPERVRHSPADNSASGGIRVDRWYDFEAVARAGLGDPFTRVEDALEAVDGALRQSVAGQLMADVPVGIFLSGGIDSALLSAYFQELSPSPIQSFTLGFELDRLNEAPQARAIAERLGTVHHEMMVTGREARNVIPLLPEIFDEPFADSSQIPTYLVSKLARRDVTVALSGDGGDEMFGGYIRHRVVPMLWNGIRAAPRPVGRAVGRMMAQVPPRIWAGLGQVVGQRSPDFGSKVHRGWMIAARSRGLADVLDSFLDEWSFEQPPVRGAGPRPPLELALGDVAPAPHRLMAHDVATYLPNDILTKVDRASMATSLETRAPFLDHRLAAVAARIPAAMNLSRGAGKLVLRELLRRKLPASLVDRPKAGFAVPLATWLRGPLCDWAEELLSPAALAESGLFEEQRIARRWEAQKAGQDSPTQSLWAVLMFQSWYRQQRSGPATGQVVAEMSQARRNVPHTSGSATFGKY